MVARSCEAGCDVCVCVCGRVFACSMYFVIFPCCGKSGPFCPYEQRTDIAFYLLFCVDIHAQTWTYFSLVVLDHLAKHGRGSGKACVLENMQSALGTCMQRLAHTKGGSPKTTR